MTTLLRRGLRVALTTLLLLAFVDLAPAQCGNFLGDCLYSTGLVTDRDNDGRADPAVDPCLPDPLPCYISVGVYNNDDDNENDIPDYAELSRGWDDELIPAVVELRTRVFGLPDLFALCYDETVFRIYDENYNLLRSETDCANPVDWHPATLNRDYYPIWIEVISNPAQTTCVNDATFGTTDCDSPCVPDYPTQVLYDFVVQQPGGFYSADGVTDCVSVQYIRVSNVDLDIDSRNNDPDYFNCASGNYWPYDTFVNRYVAEDADEAVGHGKFIPTNWDDSNENWISDYSEDPQVNPSWPLLPACVPPSDDDFVPISVDLGPIPYPQAYQWRLEYNADKVRIWYMDTFNQKLLPLPENTWLSGSPDGLGDYNVFQNCCQPLWFGLWLEGLERSNPGEESIALHVDRDGDGFTDYQDIVNYTAVHTEWVRPDADSIDGVAPVTNVGVSLVRPLVELDALSVVDLQPTANGNAWRIPISGVVRDPLSDLVSEQTIDTVAVYYDFLHEDNLITIIDLQHVDEPSSLWRPFASHEVIPTTFVEIPLAQSTHLVVRTSYNSDGNAGEAEIRVEIGAERMPSWDTFAITEQAFSLTVPTSLDSFQLDTVTLVHNNEVFLGVEEKDIDGRFATGHPHIDIAIPDDYVLTSQVDALPVRIRWGSSGGGYGEYDATWVETSPGSNTFQHLVQGSDLYKGRFQVSLVGALSPASVDALTCLVGTNETALAPAHTLIETGANTNFFTNIDKSVTVEVLEYQADYLVVDITVLDAPGEVSGGGYTGKLSAGSTGTVYQNEFLTIYDDWALSSLSYNVLSVETSSVGPLEPMFFPVAVRSFPPDPDFSFDLLGQVEKDWVLVGAHMYAGDADEPLIGYFSRYDTGDYFFKFTSGVGTLRTVPLADSPNDWDVSVDLLHEMRKVDSVRVEVSSLHFVDDDGNDVAPMALPFETTRAISRSDIGPNAIEELMEEFGFRVRAYNWPPETEILLRSTDSPDLGVELLPPNTVAKFNRTATLVDFGDYLETADKCVAYSSPNDEVISDVEWNDLAALGIVAIHNNHPKALGMSNRIFGTMTRKDDYDMHHVFNAFRGNKVRQDFFKKVFAAMPGGFNVNDYCIPALKGPHRFWSPFITDRWEEFQDAKFPTLNKLNHKNPKHAKALRKLARETFEKMFDIADEFGYADRLHQMRPYGKAKKRLLGESVDKLAKLAQKTGGPILGSLKRARWASIGRKYIRWGGKGAKKAIPHLGTIVAVAVLVTGTTAEALAEAIDRPVWEAEAILAGNWSLSFAQLVGQEVDGMRLGNIDGEWLVPEHYLTVGDVLPAWLWKNPEDHSQGTSYYGSIVIDRIFVKSPGVAECVCRWSGVGPSGEEGETFKRIFTHIPATPEELRND